MLSVVCWKWRSPKGYRSTFTAEHVNTLFRMVKRHYPEPHRSICVTDDPMRLERYIEVVPISKDWADIPSPHGGHNPSCYRRLVMFSPQAKQLFGERFVSLDLDTVVTGDLRPLWDRPEDFVMWGETDPRSDFNGSMLLMSAGARPQVWDRFNPTTSPAEAKAAGKFGSDQGWISHILGRSKHDGPDHPQREATWTTKDGVYSYRIHLHPNRGMLPDDARIVMWHGGQDPWGPHAQRLDWVRRNYQ